MNLAREGEGKRERECASKHDTSTFRTAVKGGN